MKEQAKMRNVCISENQSEMKTSSAKKAEKYMKTSLSESSIPGFCITLTHTDLSLKKVKGKIWYERNEENGSN